MLKVHKLDHIHRVARILQDGGTDGIGQQGAHALPDDAVLQKQVQLPALPDAEIDLVLTAGYGEDMLHLPADRVGQGVVGGGIAGVERDHHVDLRVGKLVARHIGDLKAQALISVTRGDLVAVLHHVSLKIIADDFGLHAAPHRKIIVQNKGEIGLAAAKVQNADAVGAIVPDPLSHQLHETVDLAEFIVLCPDDPEILCKHAEVDQRRDILTLTQDVILFPVVAPDRCRAGNDSSAAGLFIAAVAPEDILAALRIGDDQDLAVFSLQVFLRPWHKRLIREVLVKSLVVFKALGLKDPLSFQDQRAQLDLPGDALVVRLGENRLAQRR